MPDALPRWADEELSNELPVLRERGEGADLEFKAGKDRCQFIFSGKDELTPIYRSDLISRKAIDKILR